MSNAFFAFPSKPENLQETVLEAVKILNKKNYIKIVPWTDINQTGRIIITQILKKIDNCELFLCDLSDLNPNVCFELGYAIAKEKAIWVIVDGSNRKYIDLINNSEIFSIVGYSKYINDRDIISSFCKEKPYLRTNESFISQFDGILDLLNVQNFENDILYFKSPVVHTASRKLSLFLHDLKRKTIEIDILENSYQPLKDILIKILTSKIIIVHLLNRDHENNKEINAVYSLIAGISVGFKRNIIMLAPDPYKPPMDYRQLLITHKTAKICVESVENWIYPILSKGDVIKENADTEKDSELTLMRFVLGDGQAEHEENELNNFFVETSQYHLGLQEQIGIFVGRKGSGKTANLYKIREHFFQSNQNFIVTIKPQSFKLETYVKLMSEYFSDIDLQSEITEKIWEFIIYSSVLNELYQYLENKPPYYDYSEEEQNLIEFVNDRFDIISGDFGEKIDYIYDETKILIDKDENPKKVIEIIFKEYLVDIKKNISEVLKGYQRIVILIDNLDKAWDFGKNIDLQCKIIYGLIGFHNSLIKDLHWEKGDVRLLIFLREDIFTLVLKNAREPDKILLNTYRLEWNDIDLLIRIIEERFLNGDSDLTIENIWNNIFCDKINGIVAKEYIFDNIIKRPRDLIYLIKSAINESINHRHKKIEANDIITAQKTYFEFLVSNTVTEYKLFLPEIKSIIYSFFGCDIKFDLKYINSKLKPFITKKFTLGMLIEFLINISFLGLEIDKNPKFSFSDNETEIILNQYKLKKKKLFNKQLVFYINPAFIVGLK